MKRLLLCISLLVLLPLLPVARAGAADGDGPEPLCPPADKYRLQRTFYMTSLKEVVRAPANRAEVRASFEALASPVKGRRQAAVVGLALAGNLELFDRLLQEADVDGLALYAEHYLNADGTLCVDSRIEEALVDQLAADRFRPAVLAFFKKNLYSSRAFFAALAQRFHDRQNLEEAGPLVRALCATRLGRLEEELLAIAGAAMPHDSPARKRLMPAVHRSLITYFGTQRLPVFSYFRELLAVEPRHEQVVYFQQSYARNRFAIYEALARQGSADSFALFVEQLQELGQQAWGPFFSNELTHLLDNLKAHPLFADKGPALVPLLARILATPSLPHQPGYQAPWEQAGAAALYDEKVRLAVYDLLAAIDKQSGADLLVDELGGLVERPEDEWRHGLIRGVLAALADHSSLSEAVVTRLVELDRASPGQLPVLGLAEVMVGHPAPVGFRFLLDRFGAALRQGGALGEAAADSMSLAARLFEVLRAFPAPRYLVRLRQGLADLYVEGVLPPEGHERLVSEICRQLGEEPGTCREQIRVAAEARERHRQQELTAAQQRWRREMAEEYGRRSSAAGIAGNIAALAKQDEASGRAFYWLVRVGEPVLPQVHAALLDVDQERGVKARLLQVLAEIGAVASAEIIVEAVQQAGADQALVAKALLALAKIPATVAGRDFVEACLASETGDLLEKMAALAYFADHQDRRGLAWSRKFAASAADPRLRAAALYLGARLADSQVREQIVAMLKSHRQPAIQDVLWLALAELAGPEDFAALVERLASRRTQVLRQAEQYVRFRHSSGPLKVELAEKLLRADTPFYSERATLFLLEEGHSDVLTGYLQRYGQYEMALEMVLYRSAVAQRIYVEARRLGYRIEEDETGRVRFGPASHRGESTRRWRGGYEELS